MQVSRQVGGPGRAPTLVHRCARRSQVDSRGCTHNRQAALLDSIAWALIAEKINALEAQRSQFDGERRGILERRAAWEAAQARVDELEAWCATVAANVEALDYAGKRLALDAHNVQVKLWPVGHEPRHEVTASVPLPLPGGAAPLNVDTTAGGSHR